MVFKEQIHEVVLTLLGQPPQITFVFHDAGETKAMQPVMRNLDVAGIPYGILAESTSRRLLENNPYLVPTPADVVQLSQANPSLGVVAQTILQNALQAPCMVTGMVSDFQKQFASLFKALGRNVVGYYDAFSFDRQSNPRAEAFKNCLSHLITPTLDSARFFQSRFSNIPKENILALGQPVLEETAKTLQQTNRLALAQRLGIDLNRPTLLWVGGAGKEYPQAFSLFCEAVRQFPQANVLLSLHPKTDGTLENTMLQQAELLNRVRNIPRNIATTEALAVTDIVLAHHSTISTQALLQGKKVLLLGHVPETDFDPIMQYRLAPRCHTSMETINALAASIPEVVSARSVLSPNYSVNPAKINFLYNLLGIPHQATQLISQYLYSISKTQPLPNQTLVA